MPLSPGTRLGPYEIVSPIGEGGMGEVYKAMDTRLDRTVAVKVLPEQLASSPERRERFNREAKAISQLNHPNICTLYDVGEQDGTDYLVMEYIEGETLAERLKKGALPVNQALEYGIQIADGLDKAHRAGIVHRDLKPANVMLTKSSVKLLDFGLARLVDKESDSDTPDAPTQQRDLTKEQTILGTPQYMAPEQLEGKHVDARADIHALGAMLYEMVTGKRAFEGDSHASLVSAIMTSTPEPPSALATTSPPSLDYIVSTCLAKKRDTRWHSAHDVAVAIRGLPASHPPESEVKQNWRFGWLGAAVGVAALAAAIGVWGLSSGNDADDERVVRMTVKLPEGRRVHDRASGGTIAISPRGDHVVFVAQPILGTTGSLFLRNISTLEATSIPGTDNFTQAAFSPDGGTLVTVDDAQRQAVLKLTLDGGDVEEITRSTGFPRGLHWDADDNIWLGTDAGSLFRVPAAGGDLEPVSTLGPSEISHRRPFVLPSDRGVLFTAQRGSVNFVAHLPVAMDEHRLLFEGTLGAYLNSGYLVYARGNEIVGARFDLQSLELTSPPFVIAQHVLMPGIHPYFAVGVDGSVVYAEAGDVEHSVVWVDRSGNETTVSGSPERFHSLRLSPDGSQFAGDMTGTGGLWVVDFERGTRTLIAQNPGGNIPRWTPDGSQIIYSSSEGNNLTIKASDGSGEGRVLLERPLTQWPLSWSPDGTVLAITQVTGANRDIWVVARDGTARPFLATDAHENAAAISPDGNRIAYQSNESGRDEIYLQPFPEAGRRVLVSNNGGRAPVWARSGEELFYRQGTAVISVRIEQSQGPGVGKPVLLFDGPYQADNTGHPNYDVSLDGERFLMVRQTGMVATELNVILNIEAELTARSGQN